MSYSLEAPQGTLTLGADKSVFVTVFGWMAVLFTGFATYQALLMSIVMGVIGSSVFSALTITGNSEILPDGAEMALGLVRSFAIGYALFSAVLLYVAISFLRRKNWARVTVLIFLCFSAVVSITLLLGGLLVSGEASYPDEQLADFERIETTMSVFFFAMVVPSLLLLGWCIQQLFTKRIKAEFKSPRVRDA